MAISLAHQYTLSTTSKVTTTNTITAAPSKDIIIISARSWDEVDSKPGISSIALSSASFAKLGSANYNANLVTEIWWAQATATTGTTLVITWAGSNSQIAVNIADLTGAGTVTTTDASTVLTTNTNSTENLTTGTYTATNTDLLLAAAGVYSNVTFAFSGVPASPWNDLTNVETTTNIGIGAAWQVNSAGTYNASWDTNALIANYQTVIGGLLLSVVTTNVNNHYFACLGAGG